MLIGIASIPERERELRLVLAALGPQADRIHVALNDYLFRPVWLREHANVTTELLGPGNLGDAEKFRAVVDGHDGLALTCDDDVLYPPDYVEVMRRGLERHGTHTIVGLHGGTTTRWSGRHGAAQQRRIRCLGELERDDPSVNVLGTGTLAWYPRHVPVWRGLFRFANCADVQLAVHAHRYAIPLVALAHEAGWLVDICPAEGRKIYESNADGDGTACDTRAVRRRLIDSTRWLEPPRRPRVRVSVATCARPGLLAELVDDLEREAEHVELEVAVFEDPTDADYGDVRARVTELGWSWRRFDRRLGRDRHWMLVSRELRDCERSTAEWFVFLPDDVRLVRHAIPRALELWARLDDPATLTLWRLHWLEGKANWTGRRPVDGPDAAEVFHVDGLYLANRRTLERLAFRCPEIRRRPDQSPLIGSGVGSRLSRLLHARGAHMYRVNESLAIANGDGLSVMNPAERELHPAVAL